MKVPLRVAILENHQSIVDGYRFRLTPPEFEIAGIAEVYADWEPLLARHPVDAALMDVKVPLRHGSQDPYPILSVMPTLIKRYPEMGVLVISGFVEPTVVVGVMEAGANGYVLKDDSALLVDLAIVVRSVVESRGIYLSPAARAIWMQRQHGRGEPHRLSPRQLEALTLCARNPDASTREVAAQMQVEPSTVRNLLSKAYLRLGVSTRMGAVAKAKQLGLI
jgi:DNA-binding NarL/FixJ family response regulator